MAARIGSGKVEAPIAYPYLWASFGWLVVVAGLGLLLRLALAGYIDVPYKNWLHGHSHIAFMGWVFNALVAGFYVSVPTVRSHLSQKVLFGLIQFSVLGMAITFPIQGYGSLSISFSTLHVVLSAVLAVWLIKDGRVAKSKNPGLAEGYWWWLLAIVWMLISALGPFTLGYLMANDLGHTPAYQLSIYFYLHFQYNGWFFFGLVAAVLLWLGKSGHLQLAKELGWARWLFAGAMLPAYALSALWLDPAKWIWWLSGIAALVQLVGLGFLAKAVSIHWSRFVSMRQRMLKVLFVGAGIALTLKLLLQAGSVFPSITLLAFNRLTVIAYLHLVFLGIITTGLIGLFGHAGVLSMSRMSRALLWVFMLSIILVEAFILWPVVFGVLPPGDTLVWSTALQSAGLGGFAMYQLIRIFWRRSNMPLRTLT